MVTNFCTFIRYFEKKTNNYYDKKLTSYNYIINSINSIKNITILNNYIFILQILFLLPFYRLESLFKTLIYRYVLQYQLSILEQFFNLQYL